MIDISRMQRYGCDRLRLSTRLCPMYVGCCACAWVFISSFFLRSVHNLIYCQNAKHFIQTWYCLPCSIYSTESVCFVSCGSSCQCCAARGIFQVFFCALFPWRIEIIHSGFSQFVTIISSARHIKRDTLSKSNNVHGNDWSSRHGTYHWIIC